MDLQVISKQIAAAIDTFCKTLGDDDPRRTHLGASVLGRQCDREIWYGFRWVGTESYLRFNRDTGETIDSEGRMQRLFSRGHSEEDRLIAYMEEICDKVWRVDPKTGRPFAFRSDNGHLGGSVDAIIKLTPALGGLVCILEAKTHNLKSFLALEKKGLEISKPEHVTQFETYGVALEIKHALYIALCKDNDQIFVQLVEINQERGKASIRRGLRIIGQQEAPPRVSGNVSDEKCRWCKFKPLCRFNEGVPDRNCRSCLHAKPVADGKWYCDLAVPLTAERIDSACPAWTSIA